MRSPTVHPIILPALLLAFCCAALSATAQNVLVPAPNAVQLRRVWTQEGRELSADEYGYNVWGGVDLTGDSIADFAVYRRVDNAWLFYKGGNPVDTIPFITRLLLSSITPVIGDFQGDGRKSIAFVRGRGEVINGTTYFFYATELSRLTDTAIAEEVYDSTELRALLQIYGGNLDGELGDELVLIDKFDGSTQPGRILIYRGGPNFTLDSPTVIVYDSGSATNNAPSNWEVHFADFDGDGRIDMVMGGSYPTGGPMLRFYWGDENSPWSWATRPPDRDLQLVQGEIGLNTRLQLFDLDGDSAADLVGGLYTSGSDGTYVYLTGGEKSARTRSFRLDAADRFYVKEHQGFAIGPINDTTGRYDMLPFGTRYVSGSSTGPDHDYDAYFDQQAEGLNGGSVFGRGGPIGDVTGDGWPDYGTGNERYRTFIEINKGIAIILAGGPYIPFDDPTMNVVEHPVAGESGGLYLWPNPVMEELHIAWKGNLKRMPARFAVFDLQGKEVVSGDVEAWRGAALWKCASVAAGTYTVVAYDAGGETIAAARVIKR